MHLKNIVLIKHQNQQFAHTPERTDYKHPLHRLFDTSYNSKKNTCDHIDMISAIFLSYVIVNDIPLQ